MARPSLREKLASSAVDTLHAFGFNGCSIQDITDAPAFPKVPFSIISKTRKIWRSTPCGATSKAPGRICCSKKAFRPCDRLRNHFTFLSERLVGCGFERGCLLGLFATEMANEYPRMREELRSVFETWCEAVESVLREAQAAGDIDPRHDPSQLARFVVNAWEGATIRLKITRDRSPIDDFFNVCFKVLLK